jgi:hypothetical protein
VVRPSVNFYKLETVLVVTSFEPVDVEGAVDSEYAPEPSDSDSTSAGTSGSVPGDDQPSRDTTAQPRDKATPVP